MRLKPIYCSTHRVKSIPAEESFKSSPVSPSLLSFRLNPFPSGEKTPDFPAPPPPRLSGWFLLVWIVSMSVRILGRLAFVVTAPYASPVCGVMQGTSDASCPLETDSLIDCTHALLCPSSAEPFFPPPPPRIEMNRFVLALDGLWGRLTAPPMYEDVWTLRWWEGVISHGSLARLKRVRKISSTLMLFLMTLPDRSRKEWMDHLWTNVTLMYPLHGQLHNPPSNRSEFVHKIRKKYI